MERNKFEDFRIGDTIIQRAGHVQKITAVLGPTPMGDGRYMVWAEDINDQTRNRISRYNNPIGDCFPNILGDTELDIVAYIPAEENEGDNSPVYTIGDSQQ